jgi:hypothetical protein
MGRLIPVIILILLLSSCKKSESDFIWEKSYGKGNALFIRTSADSGFSACGEMDGKPYFTRLNKKRSRVIDFKAEIPGLFSSAWFDTTCYITGGNTAGKMLLMRYNADGKMIWEKTLDGGFKIDYTRLFYTGNGTLLAIGTASPDSSGSGATGLLFVRFDTTGLQFTEKKITETTFVAANEAFVDNAGNIYLALTRRFTGAKPKASVAKFNNQLQKFWETELYNNPEFGAASLGIINDGSGNVYIAGNTELSTKDGKLDNSFLASLTNTGSIRWKIYLENSNKGSDLLFDNGGNLMMLNKNCFIISIVNSEAGTDGGRIRMFSVCDSYNTDAFGSGLDLYYDKNILVAGSRGGNFYLALKSSM